MTLELSEDPALRQRYATDFGGMVSRMPCAVALPRDASEVAEVYAWAATRGLVVAVRGTGHAQNAGSLSEGLVLSTERLRSPIELDEASQIMRAGAGFTIADLLAPLADAGCTLLVRPDYHAISLGGLLRAGGVGRASVRYGRLSTHCRVIELASPSGDIRTLTLGATASSVLASEVDGVITSAALATRPFSAHTTIAKYKLGDGTVFWSCANALAAKADALEGKVTWRDGEARWQLRAEWEHTAAEPHVDGGVVAHSVKVRPTARALCRSIAEPSAHLLHPWLDLIVTRERAPALLEAVVAATAPELQAFTRLVVLFIGADEVQLGCFTSLPSERRSAGLAQARAWVQEGAAHQAVRYGNGFDIARLSALA